MFRFRYKDKESGVTLTTFNAKWISWAHTLLAYTAFLGALSVGIYLHFHKIVQNQYYGYPQEWFPSVSATIGDRYPERSLFMLFIALTSGPRFALVTLWYLLTTESGKRLPKLVAGIGILRTLTCGGWTYVTSTDDHDWHDIFMISYLVATIPWTAGCLFLSPPNAKAIRYRRCIAATFFVTIIPMVYFYAQHKVHRVPGAYTAYSLLEWSLILYDVAFDAVTVLDFGNCEIVVRDLHGSHKGQNGSTTSTAIVRKQAKPATAATTSSLLCLADTLDVAAGVYQGFCFWSILTSLGIVIWYFPLWHMGISGYEICVMSTISPLLLGVRSLRLVALRNLRLLHFISLWGLVAGKVVDPVYRLLSVSFGVSMACLAWAATFSTESVQDPRIECRILPWAVGLILSSTIKFAWRTNNPIWPILNDQNGGHNVLGYHLAILTTFWFTRKAPGKDRTAIRVTKISDRSSFLAALGLGGLFFGMHSLLSDTSTMILWVWEGYPVRGPLSVPHGWLTVAAMTAGLLTGIYRPRSIRNWTKYGLACLAAAQLTWRRQWEGYYGGLVLAFYLMAICVPLLTAASRGNPGITFGIGFLIYNLMVLFHVWVVAYAFVPGGPLVREHTDWIMAVMMFLIGAGVWNLRSVEKAAVRLHQDERQARHRKRHLFALVGINIVFLISTYSRLPSNDYRPYHEESRVMTAGIWTVHFSLDNDMWSSENRIGELMKDLEIDVMGLLETDLQRIIMGNRDTTQVLAEELGMYVDYGPGPNRHTWGAAILSKFPILNSTHHLLPSPAGELAPALRATLDAYGELVDVLVFHSGQEEDTEDRRLQSEYLSKLMGSSDRPTILLSYLVTDPLKGNYNTYVSKTSGMHDVDPSDWDRWCEYILYKNLKRVGYARVSRGNVTDTELQVAKFVVPTTEGEKAEVSALIDDPDARDGRIEEVEVPDDWKFPADFKGKGKRGHYYHGFDEPRYYGNKLSPAMSDDEVAAME
ncbi:Frag1/DRAM/Sfk1 family protein [Xylariaceae sp. FL1019]|nr:Frag1/DRAM/Sfk1 family protein [Xylariaceae sp. FL1019]